MDNKENIEKRIAEIEQEMAEAGFWQNKARAESLVKEHRELKEQLAGAGKYDKGEAVITIVAGAGGTDAEDFAKMLAEMYFAYARRQGWDIKILHENINDFGGYRNLAFEIRGKSAYGILKKESGVHRLVRISPFDAKKLRHTSFVLVDVIPKFDRQMAIEIPVEEIEVSFARSSGPGGQNVNRRETAVRVVHKPTGLAAHCQSERSQAANRERARELLFAKLFKLREEEQKKLEEALRTGKGYEIEWGNQIRSYVLHPYKLVKDHRTDWQERDVEKVLAGEIDGFLLAESKL